MATALLSLASLASDSTLADGALVNAEEHNAHRRKYRERTNNLRLGAIDLQNHYASASEPLEKRDGTFWWDSTILVMKGRRSAAWTPILAVADAYSQSMATAGTETFKLGGAIDVNTTQVAPPGAGDLMSYTIPANTFSDNDKIVQVINFGTKTGVGSVSAQFGSTVLLGPMGSAGTDWFYKLIAIRTGASTFKLCGLSLHNTDALGGGVVRVEFANNANSSAATIENKLTTVNLNTQEIMLTQLLQ